MVTFVIPLKLDSGSHPNLYRLGMSLYKVSPALWDLGINALTLPGRVSSDLAFAIGDKRGAGKISTVNIELTVRCNLRCRMCWWWGENGAAFDMAKKRSAMMTHELSTREIFDVVDQLVAHGPSFYLSGGEPFMRSDAVEIIEYISGKGMSVIMNDNGTLLTEENLKRISKIRNLTINFSIDGPREVHDAIRGKGTFDKTVATIRELVRLRGGSPYPAVKTNTTFSPEILGHADGLIRYLQDDVGVDAVRMQHLWFTDKAHADAQRKVLKGAFAIDDRGAESHVMDAFDGGYVKKLADEIAAVERTRYSKPVFIHPRLAKGQVERYYSDLSFLKRKRCLVSWNSMIIRANGDAMFCPDGWMSEFRLGNVRTERIDEMWNGEKAGRFREELYRRRMFPACARCCMING
jgi:radical SAM protein with 4Fe4S-binding SPASM domain